MNRVSMFRTTSTKLFKLSRKRVMDSDVLLADLTSIRDKFQTIINDQTEDQSAILCKLSPIHTAIESIIYNIEQDGAIGIHDNMTRLRTLTKTLPTISSLKLLSTSTKSKPNTTKEITKPEQKPATKSVKGVNLSDKDSLKVVLASVLEDQKAAKELAGTKSPMQLILDEERKNSELKKSISVIRSKSNIKLPTTNKFTINLLPIALGYGESKGYASKRLDKYFDVTWVEGYPILHDQIIVMYKGSSDDIESEILPLIQKKLGKTLIVMPGTRTFKTDKPKRGGADIHTTSMWLLSSSSLGKLKSSFNGGFVVDSWSVISNDKRLY